MLHRSTTAAGLTATALALTAAVPPLATGQDLRSPDARDVTRARTVAPVRIVTVAHDRFDWSDAAIGAGGAIGLSLLLAGGASTVARRRAGRDVVA